MAFNFSASLDLSTSMRLSQELSVFPGRGRRALYMFGSCVTSIVRRWVISCRSCWPQAEEGGPISIWSFLKIMLRSSCPGQQSHSFKFSSSLVHLEWSTVAACRLLLLRWGYCLLDQVDRKYHGRFFILPFIVCLVFFYPLLLLFLSHNLVIFLLIDRREKCRKSWFLLFVKVCNVRSSLCLLGLKSGCCDHWKESSSKIHWIFDCQSAIFTDTGSLVLVQNSDMHISFGSLGHFIY